MRLILRRFAGRLRVMRNSLAPLALVPMLLASGSPPEPMSDAGWLFDAANAAVGVAKAAAPGATGQAFGWVQDAMGKGKAGAEMLGAYGPLTDGDKAADPNFRPAGSPAVPASCTAPDGKSGAGCNECYARAYAKLTAVRLAFEKLRRVNATTQAFATKSIAFGDAVSGVHGVAGIGWQPERTKIENSVKEFNKAYDAKYNELAGLLQIALKDIGQCEAKHFKVNDWYDRYGFMYYTFMADRYRQ